MKSIEQVEEMFADLREARRVRDELKVHGGPESGTHIVIHTETIDTIKTPQVKYMSYLKDAIVGGMVRAIEIRISSIEMALRELCIDAVGDPED